MNAMLPELAGARQALRRVAATTLAAMFVAGCGAAPPPTSPAASPASSGPVTAPPRSEPPASTPVPAAGTWIEAGEMTVPREGPHLVLLGDGRVLAVGNDGSNDPTEYNAFCAAPDDATAAELWDPATGQWTPTASLATPRALLVAVPLADGRALVTGGASGPKAGVDPWVIGGFQSYSSTWIFDPETERWAKSGLLDTARTAPAGTTLDDGRVLVAGGFFADVFRWSDWEGLLGDRYNSCQPPQGDHGGITTAAWHPGGPLLDVPMPHPPARALASAEVYDPGSGTWSGTGSLAVPRTSPAAVRLADGRVLVADLRGGPYQDVFYELDCDERAERVAEVYDPASGRFRVTGEYPTDGAMFYGRALVALADGSALLFGSAWRAVEGSDTDEEWTAVLRYDSATNEWRDAGRLETRRENPTVVLLPDGRVLVAGGEDQYGPSLTTEIYDPATETSRPAAPMPEPRVAGRAVVLQDGSVLLAGGYGRHASMAVRYVPGE